MHFDIDWVYQIQQAAQIHTSVWLLAGWQFLSARSTRRTTNSTWLKIMPTRMVRLLQIYDTINRNRYPSVQDLCEMFEVAERTIHQDIQCLKHDAGLRIMFDRAKNGYYNAEPNKRLPEFELTEGEVFAVVLGKEMVSQYTGTSFEPVLRSAIEKIEQRLPEKVKLSADDLVGAVKFDPIGLIPISRKMFFDLNEACSAQKERAVDLLVGKQGRGHGSSC